VVAIAFAWGDLASQTVGGALTAAESAVSGLVGHSRSVRSGDVAYGLLSGQASSPQAVLDAYRRETLRARVGSPAGTYVPASVVARYPTPVVNRPPPLPLPLTGTGRLLSAMGIPIPELNSLIRQAAAKGEQLFVGIGLVTIVVVRRLRRQVGREFFFLCVGSTAIVALITVLPNLSVDYGVLRAFQGALILIAPVLVAGSLAVFSPLGQAWALRAAAAVGIGIFVSTTGLLPQLTGGYPAQLNLNNSGLYYDIYYMQPQEEAAISWLRGKRGVLPDGIEAESFTDEFYFNAKSDVTGRQSITDIYPSLVRRSSWVLLGYSTVRLGEGTTFYDGDTLTYTYPMGFLQNNKNLVYNNGGAEIFR
jgi:energy-converting hydrogenase Eha subunit A